jgi:predicted AAA+ superfamily ATPase
VIITGSSSKLLSSELSTHLTGRHLDLLLFPFSFKELLKYKKIETRPNPTTEEKAEIMKTLEDYLYNGGFPERLTIGKQITKNIYEDIITKDVVIRHKIKHVNDLRQIARYMIANTAKEFTYSSLKNITRVKNMITLTNWVKYIEEAYLAFTIEKFSYKLKQTILAPKKTYSVDNGITNEINTELTNNKGRLMENTVAIELIKKSKNQRKFNVYYWKNQQGKEVDFITQHDKTLQLIQVTNASNQEKIQKREYESLLKASEELQCNNLTIITWDYEKNTTVQGKKITHTPLWKWLLQQE